MSRTEFLVNNPHMIDALAIRVGMPYRELEDFRQEVILQSMIEKDDYDPTKSKLSTYTGNYIKMRAINYLKKMCRFPWLQEDFEYIPSLPETEPA